MPWYVFLYIAITCAVALVCYVAGVAFAADNEELGLVIVLGCTIVPVASVVVGVVWPLALFALIIWLAVNR
jgi:hypothetical protein